MSLLQRAEGDLSQAILRRDEVALRTLRMLKSALVQAAIAKRPAALTEADEVKALRTEIKRRQEAIAEYQRGGRQDLVERETAEQAVLRTYLLAGPDQAAIQQRVASTVAQLNAGGPQDFGRVMGAVMKELGGNVDGAVVSSIVKEALSAQQKKA